MKDNMPKFRHKVVAIPGDCNMTDMGLRASDRSLLTEDVTHIFHVAATVRFDEKLRLAIGINVMGTHNVLELAKQMTRLKVPADGVMSSFKLQEAIISEFSYNFL
jgi:fatty acyl-CoA reductase